MKIIITTDKTDIPQKQSILVRASATISYMENNTPSKPRYRRHSWRDFKPQLEVAIVKLALAGNDGEKETIINELIAETGKSQDTVYRYLRYARKAGSIEISLDALSIQDTHCVICGEEPRYQGPRGDIFHCHSCFHTDRARELSGIEAHKPKRDLDKEARNVIDAFVLIAKQHKDTQLGMEF